MTEPISPADPPRPGAAHPAGRRAVLSRTLAWQLGGLLLLLGTWWLVTDGLRLYPPYVFPSPSAVWAEISYGLWGTGPQDGKLMISVLGSLRRVLTGYALALLVGGGLGVLMGIWAPLRATLGAYLTGIQSVPSIAFVPFAILFFGLNERAVLAVVILEALIPVALAVSGALLNVPPALRVAGRTLGASGPALTLRVLLPAALPSVLGGLRTAWSFAWRALIGGELLIAGAGSLGEQLEVGRNTANVALVLATILIIGLIGGLFDALLRRTEARVRRDYGLEVNA
ncbi:ABC transporter permease [Deinococcus sp. SL84]|uniref:ABC transporter permease n=1 Tax=Deinococcus sp. SL84 TaxID=2994663 RepID=UPI002273F7CD|nr:ABC transporter permease subunit [Deinococcus sp. SL84]MCY1704024.1 ABC transporter permease subunit [Deinococcus sp. SL84]